MNWFTWYAIHPSVFTRFIIMRASKTPNFNLTALATGFALAIPAFAQQVPDAGQTLRQLQAAPLAPSANQGAVINVPQPIKEVVQTGGAKIEVNNFVFEGNKNLTSAELLQLLSEILALSESSEAEAPIFPKQLDMSELARMALEIEHYYRSSGFPFAQAYIPEQKVAGGQVRIAIIEGTYDGARAESQVPGWKEAGQKWLANMSSGQVIRKADLERVALLLQDLPGVSSAFTAEPGTVAGTASVDVDLQRKKPYDGEVGLTNHGSRYSGVWHARAQANFNSPFMMGDQVAISALHSDHKMWQAAVNYNAPLGFDGLRGQLGYSDTRYDLTKGFEGNSGNAKLTTAGLMYPILRSSTANVRVSATLQEKQLFNSRTNGTSTETYSVNSLPLSLIFDRRDELGAGGITYGMVSWTHGDLKKEDAIRQGSFQKFNLDASRIQTVTPQISLYGRFASQWANKNLDSAEGMGLGGASGVRAYPSGEAYGDEGWLAQIELRYAMGEYAPYAFYDHGRIKVNAKPSLVSSPSPDQERAGAGFGLRYERQQWRLDAAVAWRTHGGAPTATQGSDPKPRAWIALSYKY